MKILSSEVAFNTQHQKEITEEHKRQQSTQSERANAGLLPIGNSIETDVTELSYHANMRSDQSTNFQSKSVISKGSDRAIYEQNNATQAISQATIGANALIRNVRLAENSSALLNTTKENAYLDIKGTDELNINSVFTPQQARIEIKETHTYKEKEQLHVGSQGTVTTADGQKIDFMLHLDMRREFSLEQSLEIESSKRQLIDPLIINLEGGTASLTTNSFSFDLNADGKNEDISFAGQGSGFLAFDKNEDGKINNGSELFGTGDLNGFADLAKYDDDNNKWIDESDAIFEKLKVWTKDNDGNDQLISLKDAGVGAIYLGSSVGSFDLTDKENNLLGQVKRSGVFLTEKGEVASIQELDIAIREPVSQAHTNNTMLNNSLERINEQISDMENVMTTLQPNITNLNISANAPIKQEQEQNEATTLIDLLFPEPNSQYHRENMSYHSEVSEQKLEKSSSVKQEFNIIEDEEKRKELFKIDETTINVMKKLEEKTLEKITESEDSYAYIKGIIKYLAEQTSASPSVNKS